MSESSGLPPEQEAVRRLLADARHDGPPPPDVVSRLDETLASLTSERASDGADGRVTEQAAAQEDRSPGRVVDIGSRRRRVASIGLLAAASVVVAGVAIGQVLPRGSDDSGGSSAGSQSDTSLAESSEGAGSGADSSTEADGSDPDDLADSEAAREPEDGFLSPGLGGYPTLFSDDDDLDIQLPALRPDGTAGRQRLKSLAALRACDGVQPGPAAALVSAQVDGELGLVVFRRPVGEAQGVELYVCGQADPVRTITLPAP